MFIYGPEFRDVVADLRGLAPSVRHWVALGQPDRPGDQSFSQREACSGADLPEAGFDWEQPWVICYTGGTTGLPKGAILTHRAITANAVNTVVSWGLTADDVAILNAPLFHTGGLNALHRTAGVHRRCVHRPPGLRRRSGVRPGG
ncbi:class I adenylate-forming enzyme family protein [Candidatus Amarobacter glycogenicus]|uniref:class I adenylate-forming enzyme family protein n=1 Tax=Candidatus Amarobacter glycogenicus TaxID=3140699 RepID=UPI0031CCA05E